MATAALARVKPTHRKEKPDYKQDPEILKLINEIRDSQPQISSAENTLESFRLNVGRTLVKLHDRTAKYGRGTYQACVAMAGIKHTTAERWRAKAVQVDLIQTEIVQTNENGDENTVSMTDKLPGEGPQDDVHNPPPEKAPRITRFQLILDDDRHDEWIETMKAVKALGATVIEEWNEKAFTALMSVAEELIEREASDAAPVPETPVN